MLDIKNMKVATKLSFGFGLIVLLMIISGVLAYLALQATTQRTNDIVQDKVPKMQMAAQINYYVLDIARNLRNALLEAENPEKMEVQIARVMESRGKIREIVEQLKPKILVPEGKAVLARILEARTTFIEGQDNVIRLLREKKAVEARDYLLTEMRKRQGVYAQATNELQALQEKLMQAAAVEAERQAGNAMLIIVIALLASIGLSALVGWLIVRDLVTQLGGEPAEAAAEVGRIAAGDLSATISLRPGDSTSLLASLRTMQLSLATLVGEIRQMVDAAAQGNFSNRISVADKQGFGRDIGEALNLLADTTDTGLNDVMRVARALSVGDLNQRIEKNYPGVFGHTGTAVNATVDALKLIVADIDRIVQAANLGDFSIRVDLAGKQGFGRDLSELLNQLSATTEAGLKDIMRVAGTLAQGDLTQTIEKDYPGLFGETRAGINTTVANLTTLIGQLKESVALINTAASEIAAGNQDLSSRTEEQASSLEETASSMEELTSTVKENTEGANKANRDARAAADVAARGGTTVKGSVATMEEISASSKKIADIVGVIDSIAFQTNILALNAAVEAARAGEQGRGFAVVATEVRNLAKRSGDAAREIKDLIGDTLTRIDNGAAQANLAGAQMDEIVAAIASVSQVISDIASAGVEQSTGIEQVTQAVSQMDEVTQQNAALVEEAAAAAESLREQAEQLSQAIGQFKLTGAGAIRSVPPRRLPPPARGTAHAASPVRLAGKPVAPPAAHAGTSDDEWAEF